MKVALAQINSTIGDFEGNARKIRDFAAQAARRGADLCLFPEQCIPGYPSQDLLERSRFIEQNLAVLQGLVLEVHRPAIVVGYAEPHQNRIGKGLYNSAALIAGGRILSTHRKSLLPVYDVFDEGRYFDPAPALQAAELNGRSLGVTICEDVWNDTDFWRRRLYDRDPAAELVRMGVEFLLNIAASPFTLPKRHLRREMLVSLAKRHARPLLFVNMVGGNDDLVFDGASLALDAQGRILAQGGEFREELVMVDLPGGGGDRTEHDPDDDAAALEALILGTRDYAHKCGFKQALLGLSGGIDSSLVAAIGAAALGQENIEGWLMPSRYTSKASVDDALRLAELLGISCRTVPIGDLHDSFRRALTPIYGPELGVTDENIQARIRGSLLMANSNFTGRLLLTTGNKSEMATGYCTLYGDMAGGLAVISDVPKTMVFRLARIINRNGEVIPESVIAKAPSAELRENQKDSDSLPPYDVLDGILEAFIVGGRDPAALQSEGWDPTLVERVLNLVQANEYKRRQAPPGIKITSKAFGFGRRMPLASRWKP